MRGEIGDVRNMMAKSRRNDRRGRRESEEK